MPDEIAYLVPFAIEVSEREVTIVNRTLDDVPWVSVQLVGAGVMTPIAPGRLDAGGQVRAAIAGARDQTSVQVLWFRADRDGPYVWRWAV